MTDDYNLTDALSLLLWYDKMDVDGLGDIAVERKSRDTVRVYLGPQGPKRRVFELRATDVTPGSVWNTPSPLKAPEPQPCGRLCGAPGYYCAHGVG